MEDYKKLSIRYLKLNKRRSIVTILGVTTAVMVLYILLNLGWSRLLKERKDLRETQDYEMVLFTETAEQIERITGDDRVRSASVGQYHYDDYYNPKTYKNALYINTENPYRLNKIFNQLCNTYGVEGELNRPIARTYMQGEDGSMTEVIILTSLLVSFIFAIFGVGIVRNSIQLSILEQIKDYGNLRCVGASKGQLKTVVYIEGAILEITGIVIGVLAGTIVSMIIGHLLKWDAGFHFVPIVPLVIAFLGDLFFAMEENCKVIVNMSPISAIRGEYRIRKEKIKVRKQSAFGKIFGIEGDYAYKSIMRNPGRFHRTVWALAIGIGGFVAIAGVGNSMNGFIEKEKEMSKYFHVFYEAAPDALSSISQSADQIKSSLPPAGVLENIANLEEVTEAKRIYGASVFVRDIQAIRERYSQEYLEETAQGSIIQRYYKKYVDSSEKKEWNYGDCIIYMDILAPISCYGYDEEDYQRYQKVLTDGTLDVSENGLVLVNGGNVVTADSEESIAMEFIDVNFTDYKVGDTIDIVDMSKLRSVVNERLEVILQEYEAEKEKLSDGSKADEEASMARQQDELASQYRHQKSQAVFECWQELAEAGEYKTYTIEGIVSEDVNRQCTGNMIFILPLDKYYKFTDTDESMLTGMQYHFDKFSVDKFKRASSYDEIEEDDDGWCNKSFYPELMEWLESMKKGLYGFMLVVIFITMMVSFNIINTSASNLYLRRKEFAQLRVIGISKKHLMKMVLLEGVITAVTANGIGIILGSIISGGVYTFVIRYLIGGLPYRFPFAAVLSGIVISSLITCGSLYVPLKELKQDMASDLSIGGD